jgi:hypothetical protein
MSALTKSLLLFALNWLDAQLTLIWVHSNLATEGNGLMSQLLNLGDAPFMVAKIAVGAFAAYMLYRASHLPLARHGMRLALAVYLLLMMAHLATGITAIDWSTPFAVVTGVGNIPSALLTLLG